MTTCACPACVGCCEEVPGWFTPEEASAAIDAGLASRLSLVRERGNFAIAPSRIGCEGAEVLHDRGACTFLKRGGHCEIHESGFKPIECRTGFGCKPGPDYPSIDRMHAMWESDAGQACLEKWRTVRGEK